MEAQERAHSILKAVPKLNGFRAACHAVMLRVHVEWISHTLFSPDGDGDGAILVRSWDFDTDYERADRKRLVSIEPTIDTWQAPVPRESIDSVLEAAAGCRVPVRIPEPETGSDGTAYELSFVDSAFASARFHWWRPSWMDEDGMTRVGSPQPGWESLDSLFDAIVDLARTRGIDPTSTHGFQPNKKD